MTPVTIHGIRNCDTMKKAFAWLTANGIAYDFVDYRNPGVAEANLPGWCARSGWETLLNRRGLMWKKLPESERADIDEAKARALMTRYPVLIKRPVLTAGETLLVGFDPQTWTEKLK